MSWKGKFPRQRKSIGVEYQVEEKAGYKEGTKKRKKMMNRKGRRRQWRKKRGEEMK